MSFSQFNASENNNSVGRNYFEGYNNQPAQPTGGYGIANDPNKKWNELQQSAYQSVTAISTNITQVKHMISKIGSYEDSLEFRNKIRTRLSDTSQLCTKVSDSIKTMTKMNADENDLKIRSDRKVILTKLSKDFADWLQAYKEISQQWVSKEKQNIPIPQKSSVPSNQSSAKTVNPRDEERQSLLQAFKQDVVSLDNEIDFQEIEIRERAKGIEEVQTNILEINEMFKDLGIIVQDQGQMIGTFADHIEHARADVEQGVVEIEKATEYQKKAGSKTKMIVCLLIIIMAVILIGVAISVFVFTN